MITLVYDERWNSGPVPGVVRAIAEEADHLVAVSPTSTLPQVRQLTEALHGASRIVVLGGGGVIDKAKLAGFALTAPIDRYVTSGRAGIATLPARNPPMITAIPTTLGTGAEANAKAVLEVSPKRRRLILGEALLPANYQHVPEVYATLTKEQVIYGILEVFFRAAGIYAVVEKTEAPTFAGFITEAVALAQRAYTQTQQDAALMKRAARLSVATHEVKLRGTQLRWVWPLWYLANELSSIAGITKLEATIALTDPVIARLGAFGYGDSNRVAHIEGIIGVPIPDFVADMSGKLAANTTRRIVAMDVDRLVNQTLRQWAGCQLALRSVQRSQLYELYLEVQRKYA